MAEAKLDNLTTINLSPIKPSPNLQVTMNAKSTKQPEKTPAVFDRLYHASTASSKTRKTTGPAVTHDILEVHSREDPKTNHSNHKRPSSKRPSKPLGPQTNAAQSEVFNRLYKSTTSSCQSKYSTSKENTTTSNTSRATPNNKRAPSTWQ